MLHGGGAVYGVDSGGEGDHEPVAQPLHLLAAVRRRRPGQELVMGPEDPLGVLVAGAGQQLG